MRRSADPALPVADNLLRQGKLGGGLGPTLLFIIEVRRVSPVMLKADSTADISAETARRGSQTGD
ncbi:Uncharacterised protein [Klebsiella variicola]|uniref:Uncharacterized protein n=1 Tax=Klebsiella variicola TaxID=244366 RepID=A0A7H4MQD7_KLEVA|nr:Uncharacterised protein [Klebsiella variicola]